MYHSFEKVTNVIRNLLAHCLNDIILSQNITSKSKTNTIILQNNLGEGSWIYSIFQEDDDVLLHNVREVNQTKNAGLG